MDLRGRDGDSAQAGAPASTDAAASKAIDRRDFVATLDELLGANAIKDYCPNGLQVEGSATIRRVLTAVTATQRVVDEAVRWGADAVLVHHGWFWRGESPVVAGPRRRRLAALLGADINLIAYHLPLDVHPELGNNRQLADDLGWCIGGRTGEHELVNWCDLSVPLDADRLAELLRRSLEREPLLVGHCTRPLRRVAWCTGAAQDFIEAAAAIGADAFISGEISERTTHAARELGIVYAAAGHHATERGGIKALGNRMRETFGVQTRFFDDPNPV